MNPLYPPRKFYGKFYGDYYSNLCVTFRMMFRTSPATAFPFPFAVAMKPAHCLVCTLWIALTLAAVFLMDGANTPLTAQTDMGTIDYDSYVLKIHRATAPIAIDGKLEDKAWSGTEPIRDFIQHFPTDSAKPALPLEVRATYDEKYIYFGITCYDSTNTQYLLQSLGRDFTGGNNDNIALYIDPQGTKLNGFMFAVSPAGTQREGFIPFGGAFNVDQSWDNVWLSEVHHTNDRWTAEFAIPFKSIRYEGGKKRWRINIARFNAKNNEISTWTRFPFNFRAGSLAHTGILEWDTPPESPGVNLSIIPSAVGTISTDFTGAKPNEPATKLGWNLGVDLKYAVTPSLNLDVTIFPDFSNVSVDRQITNLDRFSIFFPEQRQFFVENADLFSSFGFSRIRPFFSRKIGIAQASDGSIQNTPIPVGARLSGNLTPDLRIGLMSIQTAANPASGIETQNYTVAAAQYRLFGQTNLDMIFVNRQGNNYETPGNNFNRTAGLDLNHTSTDGVWRGRLFYHQMFTPNDKPQQFATAGWLTYATPGLELNWNHEYIGENYTPEVGFVPRSGVFRLQPSARLNFFPADRTIVQQHGMGTDFNAYWDSRTRQLLDREWFGFYYVTFANTAEVSAFAGNIYTYLFSPFDPTGLRQTPLPVDGYEYIRFGVEFNTDRRAALNASGSAVSGTFFNGTNTRLSGSVNYRFQPYGSVGLNAQRISIRLPSPYTSADLTLIGTQLEFTPTRDLFFNAFLQYNTQINNVNLNARLQWRFAPMSDVFLVYTDNYGITELADRWLPDLRVRNRYVALKFTYWFNA
jgi:hypothetical protein